MLKLLMLSGLAIFPAIAGADPIPATVIAGTTANLWNQSGLFNTGKPFDLAIQGHGFFVLRLPNGEQAFSRYGEMSLDAQGFLVNSSTHGTILGFCGAELEPINLSKFGYSADGSPIRFFETRLDGSIVANYQNDRVEELCTVALALFQNPSMLKRSLRHLLHATADSGEPLIGAPQTGIRGSIYGDSLEALDEERYQSLIMDRRVDKVVLEITSTRLARERWYREKTLFYVENLKMTHSELSQLDKIDDEYTREMEGLVTSLQQTAPHRSEQNFDEKIKLVQGKNEQKVLEVIGSGRLEEAKKFRETFNSKSYSYFGNNFRFTGF
jgi:flagellar basal body rod protein FlgF